MGGFELTMSIKNTKCVITAAVSDNERKLFTAMAHDLDVSCNVLMRRLVRYFLEKEIVWTDLFGQNNELPVADDPNNPRKKQVRTTLAPEQYAAFAQRVETWGSTTAIIIRRLILFYIAGKIERGDIW
jgi:hypothetical protein